MNPGLLEIDGNVSQRVDAPECRKGMAERGGEQHSSHDARRQDRCNRKQAARKPRRDRNRQRQRLHRPADRGQRRPDREACERDRDDPDGACDQAIRYRPPLPLQPPYRSNRQHRDQERERAGRLTQAGNVFNEQCPVQCGDVMSGEDRGERREQEPFEEQGRCRGLGRPSAERLTHTAIEAAADEQGARLDVGRTGGDTAQDRRQHEPRRALPHRRPRHAANQKCGHAQLDERPRGRPPHRHVGHERPRRQDDRNPFCHRRWKGTLVTTVFGLKRRAPLMSSARWLWNR